MALLISSCSLRGSVSELSSLTPDGSKYRVEIDLPNVSISEGSSILTNVILSDKRSSPTVINVSLSSPRNDVSADFMPIAATVTIPPNTLSAPLILTTVQDSIYEKDETFSLNLAAADPSAVEVVRPSVQITVVDDDPKPVVNFQATSQNINEGAGTGTITVNLDRASAFPITVPYTVSNGTASGSDYTLANGSVSFAAGETTKTISFSVTDDAVTEPAETFSVTLGAGTSDVTLGTTTTHTVTIVDNETTNLSIDNVSVNEGGNLVFTVTLSTANASNVQFDWATSAGTATNGVDYTDTSGTATVLAGSLTKTITIPTVHTPGVCEADKTITVTLSNAVNATIAVNSSTGTILDVDLPSLSLVANAGTEGSTIGITAALNAACATKVVSFKWSNSAGTATAGSDYTVISNQSASIAAGSTSVSLDTLTVDDAIVESTETFTVTASNLTNATAGTLTATATINDNDVPVPFQLMEFNATPAVHYQVAMNDGRVLFNGYDSTHGQELWITDGTAPGTLLLKDINPGVDSSNPGGVNSIVSEFYLNPNSGIALFVATTAAEGSELWRSDGTAAGTYLVKDIVAGTGSVNSSSVLNFMGSLGNYTFFGISVTGGSAIWVTDGTTAGTQLLVPSTPVFKNYNGGIQLGSYFYFGASTAAGTYLYKSDGTTAGTAALKQLSNSSSYGTPQNFLKVGSKIIFRGDESTYGAEPWVSDGTAAGTTLLKNIYSSTSSYSSYPSMLGTFATGTKALLNASDGVSNKVWITDGTSAGTVGLSAGVSPNVMLGALGTKAVFQASDNDPWVTDGTLAGTVKLVDITSVDVSGTKNKYGVVNGLVFFVGRDAAHGYELWATDGTAAGTTLIKDIYPGAASSSPDNFTVVGSSVFFTATSPSGAELWVTDGTAAGTHIFSDINPGSLSSHPQNLVARDATHLFFTAYNPTVQTSTAFEATLSPDSVTSLDAATVTTNDANNHSMALLGTNVIFDADNNGPGNTLWKTDGTTAGTSMIKDLFPSLTCTDINYITTVGSSVFFTGSDAATGNELWVSDGTTAGTAQVQDIVAGSTSSTPNNLVAFGSKLIFTVSTSGVGQEPWVSDGTSAGTFLLKDINPGGGNGWVQTVINSDQNVLYFTGLMPGGYGLFASDTTSAGTTQLTAVGTVNSLIVSKAGSNTFVGAASSGADLDLWVTNGTNASTTKISPAGGTLAQYNARVAVGNNLFFMGHDAASGYELWVSDGTAAGTHLTKDITAGTSDSYFSELIPLGTSKVIFYEYNAGNLWVSDGTSAGTQILSSGLTSTYDGGYYLNAGSLVYFIGETVADGYTLWVSDGTAAGTKMLKAVTSVSGFTLLGGKVYFSADDGVHGKELWVSDGTTAGTQMVMDINPGAEGSSPSNLTALNGKLYFKATTKKTGNEIWVFAP
jgi:ELWxxDGT repeat protein